MRADPELFAYDATASLDAVAEVLDEADGVRRTRVEINGPSERVPLIVTEPVAPSGQRPAILIGHGATTQKDDFYIQAPATRWARDGLICVASDAPCHGERGGAAPLSHADVAGGFFATQDAEDFFVEHVISHRRVLDYMETLDQINASRLGYLGFSMGTIHGVPLVAADERLCCAVFTIGGSFGSEDGRDPANWAARIAPRPVLQLNTEDDVLFTPATARALNAAFAAPKELRIFPGTHTEFGGKVFKAMWDFFRAQLVEPESNAHP